VRERTKSHGNRAKDSMGEQVRGMSSFERKPHRRRIEGKAIRGGEWEIACYLHLTFLSLELRPLISDLRASTNIP